MSFDELPAYLEDAVKSFASQRHISHDDAVLKLIESGLASSSMEYGAKKRRAKEKPGALLIGLLASPNDAAILDQVIASAREFRDADRLRDVWQ